MALTNFQEERIVAGGIVAAAVLGVAGAILQASGVWLVIAGFVVFAVSVALGLAFAFGFHLHLGERRLYRCLIDTRLLVGPDGTEFLNAPDFGGEAGRSMKRIIRVRRPDGRTQELLADESEYSDLEPGRLFHLTVRGHEIVGHQPVREDKAPACLKSIIDAAEAHQAKRSKSRVYAWREASDLGWREPSDSFGVWVTTVILGLLGSSCVGAGLIGIINQEITATGRRRMRTVHLTGESAVIYSSSLLFLGIVLLCILIAVWSHHRKGEEALV